MDLEKIYKDYKSVFKTKPFKHQAIGFDKSKDAPFFGFLFEQGCGKTKVAIDNASYLYQKGKIEALVIIAPNGVHTNWTVDEVPDHCSVDFDSFCWVGKRIKKELDKIKRVNESKKLRVFSFNMEAFVSKQNQKILLDILAKNRCLMVIDESQGIKNPDAGRTKFFLSISNRPDYKRILTGTPVTTGVENLFTQLNFLSPKILNMSNFYAFKARYCQLKRMSTTYEKNGETLVRQFDKVVGTKNIEELQRKMDKYTYRVLKKDCLDLPPKVYQKEVFNLTNDQIRMIQEINEEGISYIEDCKKNKEPILIPEILSRLIKKQQVASGYLLNMNDKEFVEIVSPEKNPRLIRLKEVLERLKGKVIIWAKFTKDVDYIMEMLGDEAVRYDGQTPKEDRDDNKQRFQNDDRIKYFVGKPLKGLTLTQATTAIFYTNSDSLEKRLQAEDRNHRMGTKEVADKLGLDSILYIDLQARYSGDSKIISNLRRNKNIADTVLNDPASLFLENE